MVKWNFDRFCFHTNCWETKFMKAWQCDCLWYQRSAVIGKILFKTWVLLSTVAKTKVENESRNGPLKISQILTQGYSRIPVYDGERANIVYVLFVKDLMFIDPDDNMPLAMVCEYYKNEVNFVFHDTPLNVMFNEFKSGEKGHMAFVQVTFRWFLCRIIIVNNGC